ncbi:MULTISPECIES: RpoE-regulated lipoprotein [unclassified Tatumella]|uniref:RpoE-regulated lipoprotein n=1 Tax=unclassified Tatumella TaxID=2649542 RepID=UPI001BAF49D2|nr:MULTISPECIES: RpoE-regulated lipoprotein [unclassified Tatumella]MBS0876297.1 RpoE-regulated lipoprotein [Tatumella sp. JGM82]MBS0889470.1 RpoE-regulated lipoprotein [Tatumella sp. JGM94]MBS0900592.1 RpoE-regulated lipoprotein [Tatumella sp. JGM100]
MKLLKTTLLSGVILLSGCAGSGNHDVSGNDPVRWWNPLSYSWSSALPWHWFGASATVSEQGVGGLTGLTPMTEAGISGALGSDYQLRQGMRTENGDIVTFWQALRDGQVMLVIQGQSTVSRIDVSDPAITSASGVKTGSKFSEVYTQAFGHCQPLENGEQVSCQAPDSQHIRYIYQGEWHGPQGIMPADETLKNWILTRIVWQQSLSGGV